MSPRLSIYETIKAHGQRLLNEEYHFKNPSITLPEGCHYHHQPQEHGNRLPCSFRYTHPNLWMHVIHLRLYFRRIWPMLCKRRPVTIVNLLLLVFFFTELAVKMNTRNRTVILSSNELLSAAPLLPFPLYLSLVPRKLKANFGHKFPGYAGIRNATFRDRYPSLNIDGTFDAIFVLTNSRCTRQLNTFMKRANALGLLVKPWSIESEISLSDPPIPIAHSGVLHHGIGDNSVATMLKFEVAYTDAHVRIWRYLVNYRLQRLLILDDTVFPTAALIRMLPSMMSDVDMESVARASPWHMLFLRRTRIDTSVEPIWCSMQGNHHNAVTVASISHGAGAYILSLDGAQFLLDHLTSFRAPLNVQFGVLQREFAGRFITLSACGAPNRNPSCNHIIKDISASSRAEVTTSVSSECS